MIPPGADWLGQALGTDAPLSFGQLTITPCPDGGYRLEGPAGDPPARKWPADPAHLRQHTRTSAEGRYRPLSGIRDLPGGWWCHCSDLSLLAACIEAVYPLALCHRAQAEAGTLRIVPLQETLQRQAGRYRRAGQLDDDGRRCARDFLCAQCVRTPVWEDGQPVLPPPPDIPCPEACSVLMALCRALVNWQAEPAPTLPPDPDADFAEFDNPRHPWRERLISPPPAS